MHSASLLAISSISSWSFVMPKIRHGPNAHMKKT